MSNKRILIFSTAYFPFVGGAEIAIKEITDRLPELQFDLITAKMRKDLRPVEVIGRVTVHRLGFGYQFLDKFLLPYLGAFKAWRLHKNNSYKFFWCMMVTYGSGGAFAHNIFFKKKVPIILTLQEGDSESHLRFRWAGLINLSWKAALKRTTILTVISHYLLARALRLGYKGQAEVIPNGVDVKRFDNSFNKSPASNVVLVTTSRLEEKNGVADIIEAMKFLPLNTRLDIIGSGSLMTKLSNQVKKNKLEERVKFLGYIDQREMPKYLHNADVFIRPSLSEGMGNSFIEAMAAGLPVIATPVGGIPDFLFDPDKNKEHAPTGLYVNVHDPQGIARQVERLVKNQQLRATLITNAKRMVKQKYDWNIIAEQMKNRVFEPNYLH